MRDCALHARRTIRMANCCPRRDPADTLFCMRLLNVVGARPNCMEVAPLVRKLEARGIGQKLLHTGQHCWVNAATP